MRYHLTLVRLAIIKMSTNNKCWRACGDKGTLLHCWWECIPTMENSMEAPYKTKNRTTIQLSNPISGRTTGEKYGSKGYMPLYVPYRSVYNNQDMKATFMSCDWWIDKVDLVHIYNGLFSSVAQSCLTLWNPMDCSMPGLPIHHQLSEFTQTHVHRVHDAIQPSHPLSSPSPPAPNPSQHQGLFRWVNSSHEVAKVLEFQLQHQSFQEYSGLISFRMDCLDLLEVQGTLKSLLQHHSSKISILLHSAFFIVQLSLPYMTTGKTIALNRWTFVGKVMSLLFNMLLLSH